MSIIDRNQLGYAVLNPTYLKKVMGEKVEPSCLTSLELRVINKNLEKFEIPPGVKEKVNDFDRELVIPELLGENISEHFEKMADTVVKDPLRYIRKILRYDWRDLPEFGEEFSNLLVEKSVPHTSDKPWLKIRPNFEFEYLETPDSNWLVFDTETYVKGSRDNMPIIGVAAGFDGYDLCYYLWTHECILDPTVDYIPSLIPVGTKKLVIAHNIAFDAALVKERYTLNPLDNYYLCTMAMHQAANGLDSSQRWAVNAKSLQFKPKFLNYGTSNSLVKAYEFHTGKKLPSDAKDPRKLFVEATHPRQFFDRLTDCLSYAFHDILYTFELFQAVWGSYRKSCPSNVVLAGHFLLANSIVPVRPDWHVWTKRVDEAWKSSCDEMVDLLNQLADKYHSLWQEGKLKPEEDHWLSQLNWKPASKNPDSPLSKVATWYKSKVINKRPLKITGKSDTAIYLLRLCWRGQPLQKNKELAWHYINKETGEATKIFHKKGDGSNVGSVLTPTYIPSFERGDLHVAEGGDNEIAKRICELISLTSYWTMMRDRVLSVHTEPATNPVDGSKVLLVAPRVNPHGTSSGRVVDPIWVVLASHVQPKYGAAIKAQAYSYPNTHSLVGFDIDGEELQIACVYGESDYGVRGSSPIGAKILCAETKKDDFHSLIGKMAGVSRNAAKQANYAVMYGGSLRAVMVSFRLWHPDYSDSLAKQKGSTLISSMRGDKDKRGYYNGGLASPSFNKMTHLALANRPCTPILGSSIAPSSWPNNNGSGVTPGLLNFTIQSAASSFGFLSCLLLSNYYLYNKYSVNGRMCVTTHDEFIDLIVKKDKYKAAYLQSISHIWCWSLMHYTSGINDLPTSILFPSGINIDQTWRKSVYSSVATPTFEDIPSGEELTPNQLIDVAEENDFWGIN